MDKEELPTLKNGLKRIFSEYESILKKYRVPKKIRRELAESVLRRTFYCGATNSSDNPLKYKGFEHKEEEEAKIDKKIKLFERILEEYLNLKVGFKIKEIQDEYTKNKDLNLKSYKILINEQPLITFDKYTPNEKRPYFSIYWDSFQIPKKNFFEFLDLSLYKINCKDLKLIIYKPKERIEKKVELPFHKIIDFKKITKKASFIRVQADNFRNIRNQDQGKIHFWSKSTNQKIVDIINEYLESF